MGKDMSPTGPAGAEDIFRIFAKIAEVEGCCVSLEGIQDFPPSKSRSSYVGTNINNTAGQERRNLPVSYDFDV